MKSRFTLFCFLFISIFSQHVFGQQETMTRSEMMRDVNFLMRYITYVHPTVGVNIEIENVVKWRGEIKNMLPAEANRVQFLSIIDPIIDSLKCGHTGFLPDQSMFEESTPGDKTGFVPLKVKQIEDKVIITQNLSSDSIRIVEGYELHSINGIEIVDILEQLKRLHIGSDGNNRTGEAYFSALLLPYAFKMFFGVPDTFNIEVQDLDVDTTHIVTFEAPTLTEIRKHHAYRYKEKENSDESVALEVLPEGDVAVLTIKSFIGYDPFQILYKSKLKECFAELESKRVKKLIIDLRGNRGGSLRNCQKMLGYVLKEKQNFVKEASINPQYAEMPVLPAYEFRFKLSGIKKHENRWELKSWSRKKIKPHRKYGYAGDVVLMTDAGSFSAAAIFASIFKSSGRGKIVGSESGGSYYQTFAGFTEKIVLPNSRIKVNIPFIRFVHNVDESLQDINQGVIPDIEIPTTLDDYFLGLDPQLDQAIKLLNQSK